MSPTTKDDTPTKAAFERGYAAYWAHVNSNQNPHRSGTHENAAWDDGWSQAQFDDGESTAEE